LRSQFINLSPGFIETAPQAADFDAGEIGCGVGLVGFPGSFPGKLMPGTI